MVQNKSGFHHEEREENKFISSGKENMFNTSTFPPDKVSLSSLRKYYCILSETFLVFIRESAKALQIFPTRTLSWKTKSVGNNNITMRNC